MQLGHRLAGGEREMSLQLTKFIEMWNPLCAQIKVKHMALITSLPDSKL